MNRETYRRTVGFFFILLAGLVFAASGEPKNHRYRVVGRLPHDATAFTQGLVFADGVFYESTGLYGHSSLRKVDPESGRILQVHRLHRFHFGEGLTLFDEVLIQLTWKAGKAFVYDKNDFALIKVFRYDTEGWGLTHDGRSLIMSDGSHRLYFRNPQTFALEKILPVTEQDRPVRRLNELEYINGEIWANVYLTHDIVRISPETGEVLGRLNLQNCLAAEDHNDREDVLNGIAYDSERNRIFVTGKRYAYVYEIAPRERRVTLR